jgi:hypothetical protein
MACNRDIFTLLTLNEGNFIFYVQKKQNKKAKADSTLLGFVAFPMIRRKNMPISFAASVRIANH